MCLDGSGAYSPAAENTASTGQRGDSPSSSSEASGTSGRFAGSARRLMEAILGYEVVGTPAVSVAAPFSPDLVI
jgi:hypothetical protein